MSEDAGILNERLMKLAYGGEVLQDQHPKQTQLGLVSCLRGALLDARGAERALREDRLTRCDHLIRNVIVILHGVIGGIGDGSVVIETDASSQTQPPPSPRTAQARSGQPESPASATKPAA